MGSKFQTRFILTVMYNAFFLQGTISGTDLKVSDHPKSWHGAFEACIQFHSVFTGDSALSDNGKIQVLQQIKEGETAWIAGRALLSRFIVWDSCVQFPEGYHFVSKLEVTDQENIIYRCLEGCIDPKWKFVGIENGNCYCIANQDFENAKKVGFTNCSTPCRDKYDTPRPAGTCGGQGYVSLYGIVPHEELSFSSDVENFQQGVSISYEQSAQSLQVYIDSISLYTKLHGFLCVNPGIKDNDLHCLDTNGNLWCSYVFQTDWKTAQKFCEEKEGRGFSIIKAIRQDSSILHAGKSYWTGIFRTFTVDFENTPKEFEACVVVRKFNGVLYTEPEKCSSSHRYVCTQSESSIQTSSVTTDKQFSSTSVATKSWNSSTYRTTTQSQTAFDTTTANVSNGSNMDRNDEAMSKEKSHKSDNYGLPIGLSVGFLLLIGVVVTIVVLHRRSRRRPKRHIRGSTSEQATMLNDNDFRPNFNRETNEGQSQPQRVNSDNTAINTCKPVTPNVNSYSDTETGSGEPQLSTQLSVPQSPEDGSSSPKIAPRKPERKTLRRKLDMSNASIDKLGNDNEGISSSNTVGENCYDSIGPDKSNPSHGASKQENSTAMRRSTDEDYDRIDLKSPQNKHHKGPVAAEVGQSNIYAHTYTHESEQEEDAYNVLSTARTQGQHGKVNADIYDHV